MLLSEHKIGLLHELLDSLQKAGCWRAVDQPMIEGLWRPWYVLFCCHSFSYYESESRGRGYARRGLNFL